MSSDETESINPYEIAASPMTLDHPSDAGFAGRELRQLSRVQRFFAAFGILITMIVSGYALLGGIVMLTSASASELFFGIGFPLVFAAFYGLPSVLLWRAANAAKSCSIAGKPDDFSKVIKTQLAFWKVIGILFILIVALYLLAIIGFSLQFAV